MKSKNSNGTSVFSNTLSQFIYPVDGSAPRTIYKQGIYSADSSSYHANIQQGNTQWLKLRSAQAGKIYTISVLNQAGSTLQTAAIVSKTFYAENGTTFSGTIAINTNQNLYVKVTAQSSGNYRFYYTEN